jgi:two-component system NtrC family sensor kinase
MQIATIESFSLKQQRDITPYSLDSLAEGFTLRSKYSSVAIRLPGVAFCNREILLCNKMFKFPSIRQKIMLGYYAGVAVLILISLFTLTELWYMEKKVQFGGVISDFFDTTLEIRRFEKNFFLYQQTFDYQENMRYVNKAQGILDQNINEYKRLSIAPQMDSVRESLKKYKLLMTQFAVDIKKTPDKRLDLENAVRDLGKEIITIAEDVSKTERKRLQSLLIKTQRTLVFLIISLSLLGIAIGQFLSRMIVRPLQSLEEQMKLIEEGKLKTVLINSKDREIVSLTRAFNKMLKELELRQRHLVQREKLASLGTLLSGVAHELNNPLSNISSSCQILTEEFEEGDAEHKKELLSQIDEQTERAKSIVRSLLEFSRDRKIFQKETLPLKKLIEETVLFLKSEIPARIEMQLDIPSDIFILADKQRIQQVFLNLLQNAMEAIADEGKVSIRAQRCTPSKGAAQDEMCNHPKYRGRCTGECPAVGTDTVDIEIEDTGIGIPPDVLPKIFDPFFSTKDVVRKGAGLGLFIVQEIIEEHDGCIGVHSEVGKGTCFLIRLPLKK